MTQAGPIKRVHDAPWLTLTDEKVLGSFLSRFVIDRNLPKPALMVAVTQAFKNVPYENLTKIIKSESVVSASSALRYPREVISDYLKWGTGGTCFSLTAALAAVLDSLGIEAYPILADRFYGTNTHCGLLLLDQFGGFFLVDPGYLLFEPLPIQNDRSTFFETGFNRIELHPLDNGTRLELFTIVKNGRKRRLTFRISPVSDEAFAKAWEQSFAFEMMTYPILTRMADGCHQYLQGNVLAVRDRYRTERTTLTPQKQIEFFASSAGMNIEIVRKALELVNYGTHASAAKC